MAELSELMDFIEKKAEESAHTPGSGPTVEMYMEVYEQLARLEGLEK